MVLEWWTLSKRLGLAYPKINLSLLQCQSASQEKHGSMGAWETPHFPAPVYWVS